LAALDSDNDTTTSVTVTQYRIIFNADYSIVIGGDSQKESDFIAAFIQLLRKHNINASLITIDEVGPGSIFLKFSTSDEPVAAAILALFDSGNLVIELNGEEHESTSFDATSSDSTAQGLLI
jgi:hypothetical protein